MIGTFLFVGLLVAVFVGFNIGGSSTRISFGPAIGNGALGKLAAATLMTGFTLFGGWALRREVVAKMDDEIVPQSGFALAANVVVLSFVSFALLVSNTFGVPAFTSMTAVGAIAGPGLANGPLDSRVMLETISWWVVVPVITFWIYAVISRYIYPCLDAWLKLDQSPDALVRLNRDGGFPRPWLGPDTTYRESGSTVLVVVVTCYMAFSAGASDVANAVAPFVGNGTLKMNTDILVADGAIGLDTFTVARRTLDTVDNDLMRLPILATLIVETVGASLISFLSAIGIPASLAVSAAMCIVGFGQGRTTRTVTLGRTLNGGEASQVSIDALTVERRDGVPKMDEETPDELSAQGLFDPGTTGRVIFFWVLTPPLSALVSYTLFSAGIV